MIHTIAANYDEGIPQLNQLVNETLGKVNRWNEEKDWSILLHCTSCNYRSGPFKWLDTSDTIIIAPFDRPSETIQVTHCIECLR